MTPNPFSRVILVIVFSFSLLKTSAQDNMKTGFDKEFSFSADNDVLAFSGTDRYYTNGLFFKFSKVSKNVKAGIRKRINEWELGQMIFTAHKREVFSSAEIDRPIAGYLYGKFSQTSFTDGDKLLKWGVSVGSTGRVSLARQVLNDFHPFVKINDNYWGWIWDYQVKDELGINAHATCAFPALTKSEHNILQITPVSTVTLGTSFTNISQSVLFQAGRFNKMYESGFWNAQIENKESSSNRNELFFFYQPELTYQAYDATIQGGMFRSDKGRITWPVKPFVFAHHLGIFFSKARYSLAFHSFIQTKQAKFQFDNHAYGKIQVGYRFN